MNFFLQLYALRRLMQGSEQTPKAPLGNNARPLQQLHHRTIRTNIDFNKVSVSSYQLDWVDLITSFSTHATESTAELSINVQRNVL
jgi:Eukaryotic-type carbonic anhydrase